MKKSRIIDSVLTPDGRELVLHQRDTQFVIRVDDVELMSNRAYGSEQALARLGLEVLGPRPKPHALIGGLGMGFTLRALLDGLAGEPEATVVVAELFPTVVEWNRTWLGALAGHPLDDPRVEVIASDVGSLLARTTAGFDLVLLDVDNGPEPLTLDANQSLYTRRGIAAMRNALRPGGVAAVWSAGHDVEFANRMQAGGLEVEVHQVTARPGGKGDRHVIFLGRKAG